MVDLTDTEIDAALARGEALRSIEPRISAIRFDRCAGRMIVELTNDCTFVFPPRMLQGLETASDDEIARVEVLGAGSGLHWDAGDTDFSISGLLAGRFGTRAYLADHSRQEPMPVPPAGGRPSRRLG